MWPLYLQFAKIHMQNNQITKFTNKFQIRISSIANRNNCFKNTEIDLRNNFITNFTDSTLHQYYVKDFTTEFRCFFERLLIHDNPIECDCNAQKQLIRHYKDFMRSISCTKNLFDVDNCVEHDVRKLKIPATSMAKTIAYTSTLAKKITTIRLKSKVYSSVPMSIISKSNLVKLILISLIFILLVLLVILIRYYYFTVKEFESKCDESDCNEKDSQ